jgi:hypothetical protein
MDELLKILSSPAMAIAVGVVGAVILIWAAARLRGGALEKRPGRHAVRAVGPVSVRAQRNR